MVKSSVKAIFRRAGFQISRLPDPAPGVAPAALRFGPYTIESSNEALHYSYRAYPETNRVITRIVAALCSDGKRISMIDIGANCGDSAALARCGGPVAILCVEGDPLLCQTLRANLQPFDDIAIRQVFLGEAPGQIEVCMEKSGWNNTLANPAVASGQMVRLDTLDHVVEDWPALRDLGFIKCDTEGFDVRICSARRRPWPSGSQCCCSIQLRGDGANRRTGLSGVFAFAEVGL